MISHSVSSVQETKKLEEPLPKSYPKKSSKLWLWITGIISLIILVAALLLGMYWDKIF